MELLTYHHRPYINTFLKDHIVKFIHSQHPPQTDIQMFMELWEGSLQELLFVRKVDAGKYYAKSLRSHALSALIYLEQQKVIHGDIRPANILYKMNARGEFTFALAIFGRPGGTPKYKAPEVAQGKEITHKADVFRLGIVFAEVHYWNNLPLPGSSDDTIQVDITEWHGRLYQLADSGSKTKFHFMLESIPEDRYTAKQCWDKLVPRQERCVVS